MDSLKHHFPVITHELIKEKKFKSGIEEFLIAKNISHWLASEGRSPGLDTVYNEFKRDFNNSDYIISLDKKYNEWLRIAEGEPAPDITGLTISNDTVSLSQLKGKVVYIDVWASWCGPCIAEFPFYEALQKEMEGENDVEFLFVSVDKDSEKWADFLKKNSVPKGIHTNEIEVPDHPSVQEAYNMWGVPRYILIDSKGKIVNAIAPRPSSGKVEELFKGLLVK